MTDDWLDLYRVPYAKDGAAEPFSLARFDPAALPAFGKPDPSTDGGHAADEARAHDARLAAALEREPLDEAAVHALKRRARTKLDTLGDRLAGQQKRLFAQKRKRVLLVLQGMDTSGKDSTIRAVFRDVNPAGVDVTPFGVPSHEEAAHDFLWRIHRHAPQAGRIAVFNRSHYEDVLVPRVNGTLDAKGAQRRFQLIREFESLLAETGTTVVKCFLHISKDAQRERLQARIDNPKRNWKFDPSDLEARRHWAAYAEAYEALLGATSAPHAPWYIVPADVKPHRKVMVAQLLLRAMRDMDLHYPPARTDLAGIKVT